MYECEGAGSWPCGRAQSCQSEGLRGEGYPGICLTAPFPRFYIKHGLVTPRKWSSEPLLFIFFRLERPSVSRVLVFVQPVLLSLETKQE